jgi:hypothetical protein
VAAEPVAWLLSLLADHSPPNSFCPPRIRHVHFSPSPNPPANTAIEREASEIQGTATLLTMVLVHPGRGGYHWNGSGGAIRYRHRIKSVSQNRKTVTIMPTACGPELLG